MKIRSLFFLFICLGVSATVPAQQLAVPDADLLAYASIVDSVGVLTDRMRISITEMVKNNPNLTAERYNVLSQAGSDSVKLKEVKATPTELAALKEINAKREKEALKIQEVYRSLINTMGSERFSKVRNAIKEDPAIKSRYETLRAARPKAGTKP
jgi:hypothetical protein